MSALHHTVGYLAEMSNRLREAARRHDERGVSQSTEQAILVVAAFTIGTAIVAAVTVFVDSKLSIFPR